VTASEKAIFLRRAAALREQARQVRLETQKLSAYDQQRFIALAQNLEREAVRLESRVARSRTD
jgi:hypothetical protein